jgi:twitching motility protein PilI
MDVSQLSDAATTADRPAANALTQDTAGALSRMGVCVGELRLLLPVDGAREVVAPPPMTRIPHTVSWLLGIANVRGSLVPVIDPAAAFGVAPRSAEPRYLLVSGRGEAAAGLLIDGLPRLITIDAALPLAARAAAPSLLEDYVVAAYQHDQHVWMDLDLELLLDAFARQVAL